MSEYTQIERLLRILQILSAGRKITTNEVLERFDGQVSQRTLQRDMNTLQAANIPLVSEKLTANENVWYLESRFRSFIPMSLSSNEYLAAHILRSNLKIFQKTPFEKEVQSLLKKIDQLVPEDVFLELDRKSADSIFENYTAGVFDYSPYGQIINDLIAATLYREKCLVVYSSLEANKPKSYYIEPEKLVYYNGGLYVIAFMRHYKRYLLLSIQRVKKLKPTGDNFVKDQPFDEKKFWESRFGLFPGEREEVVLQFNRGIADYIDGRTWHATQELDYDKKGNLLLQMQVALSPELISWIMSWHKYVKVMQPQTLIDLIRQAGLDVARLYK